MRKLFTGFLFLILSCATTGPGGKKSLILIPTSTEIEIGRAVSFEVESSEKLHENQRVQNYVNNVGQNIAEVCDRKDLKYTFKVIDSEQVNAFACPGGFIYIYAGLMEIMDNEAQLAAVLAHEVGHIVARHSVKRLQTVYGYNILMDVLLGDRMSEVAFQMINAATFLILQGYGRDNEFEADNYGILYTYRASYNPKAMVQIFNKFKEMEGNPPSVFEQLLISHPPTQDRINKANKQIEKIDGEKLQYYSEEFAAIKALLIK
jgi:predicted Zn-dependent protease